MPSYQELMEILGQARDRVMRGTLSLNRITYFPSREKVAKIREGYAGGGLVDAIRRRNMPTFSLRATVTGEFTLQIESEGIRNNVTGILRLSGLSNSDPRIGLEELPYKAFSPFPHTVQSICPPPSLDRYVLTLDEEGSMWYLYFDVASVI